MAYKQTSAELAEHLREQLEIMRANAAQFDAGREYFAKPISTVLRTLLYGSGALLVQLGIRDSLPFIDTAGPMDPDAIYEGPRLTYMTMGGPDGLHHDPIFTAPFPETFPPLSFGDWWERPVLKDRNGVPFSRRQLTLGLAHKDGGAHIDPEMQQAYADLTRSGGLGWTEGRGDDIDTPSTHNVVLPSVRQIAWEVDKTLTDQLPELVQPPQP